MSAFRKPFDKVPQKKLLYKVLCIGFRGKIYKWIEDFLTNRQQRVIISGKASKWQQVTSGVPQGSVLGRVLFLIYVTGGEKNIGLDRDSNPGPQEPSLHSTTELPNHMSICLTIYDQIPVPD